MGLLSANARLSPVCLSVVRRGKGVERKLSCENVVRPDPSVETELKAQFRSKARKRKVREATVGKVHKRERKSWPNQRNTHGEKTTSRHLRKLLAREASMEVERGETLKNETGPDTEVL